MSSQGRRPETVALQEITSHEELLSIGAGSAFLRWDIPAPLTAPAHRAGAAFALPRRTHTRRTSLLVMGPQHDVDDLVLAMLDAALLPEGLGSVTVQRGSLPAVEQHLALGEGNEWEWLCTTETPAIVEGEERLVPLTAGDEAAIRALLAVANPRTDARPFERSDQRWVGVRAQDGSLLACGVREANVAGHAHLSGISVHPAERGTGLGLAVTARLTRDAVVESGVCTLAMYSDNDVARRVYTGLGYGDTHHWSSRRLALA